MFRMDDLHIGARVLVIAAFKTLRTEMLVESIRVPGASVVIGPVIAFV
jgi:hypothetical protein